MSVLVVDDVYRRYGDTVALDGVSLAVDEGEVFGLLGPNGAGKTTLVRAVTGTTDYVGTVECFGTNPRAVDAERIGLLPQEFAPPDRLTPRELVDFYGGLYDERRDTGDLLADVGMAEAADTHYENLSGGQKRRTCVATALVNDPDLLVLDEPTTGIDPAGRRQLWTLLEGLADRGTTILLTTHYMEEAERLADRVGLLADGNLVAVDTPEALVREYGGESLLYVEGQFDGVTEVAQSLSLDFEYSVDDGRLTVRDVPPEDIGAVAAAVTAAGIEYDSLTWTDPNLEDVYLELTGQSFATPDAGDVGADGEEAYASGAPDVADVEGSP